jgi:dTDP-4-dehydrorhamnose reductase
LRRILVLGGAGFLGSNLINFLREGYDIQGTFFSSKNHNVNLLKVDVTDLSNLKVAITSINPDIIINCVGLANVDECEKRPETSILLNAIYPSSLARLTSLLRIKLVHISTDHFESDPLDKRIETDFYWPLNQYGFSKLLAEQYVMMSDTNAIVIRTNFFASARNSNNLLGWMVSNFEKEIVINGFKDVFFSPVSTKVLADCIDKLLKVDFSGIVNISSPEKITKFDFARLVNLKVNKLKDLVIPAEINDSRLLAKRPKNLSLSNVKFEEVTSYKIPSIKDMINEVEYSQN